MGGFREKLAAASACSSVWYDGPERRNAERSLAANARYKLWGRWRKFSDFENFDGSAKETEFSGR